MLIYNKDAELSFQEFINISNEEGAAVLIDKAVGWTSFDVVAKLRRIVNVKKIGHCGTLDPFATGLLILCLAKSTKRIVDFQSLPKQYAATIKLGATTPSFDTETEEENEVDVQSIQSLYIEEIVKSFVGNIQQTAPAYSAKKVGGKKRAYELARKGREVIIAPSDVEIYSIDITKIALPFVDIVVNCGKGTYIRALARDIGEKLGVGGYLTALRRTKIGEYDTATAWTISELVEKSGVI
ncbi:MAG: tRNA pseudouridine(55) synthase TruB [Ignavibacteria bacterium]|jgi:tRNA pseudouridine55 synthase|nr:tRNA pseudouridine(55) synthase TruB [Ignavibacteria bacterium]